jgi:hypothetical protein
VRIRHSRLTRDFLQVPNATVRDDRLSHMARGILVELLSRPDGWEATADDMWRASVAKHGKNSPGRRAFRAAFAELKEHGYLTANRELLEGGRYGTVLTLASVSAVQPDVPQAGTSERPAETEETAGGTDVPHAGTSEGATDVPHAGTSERPAETGNDAGGTDVPHGGTPERPAETGIRPARTDVPHAGTSLKEHGENTRKNTSSTGAASIREISSKKKDHHLEAFGAFWSNYPKKRDREEAKKAWIAAIERGVEPKRMVDAAQAYARERADKDPQYTKYPANWLNKGCYDDEPDRPQLRAVSGGWPAPNRPHPATGAAAPAPTAEDYENSRPF